MKRIIRIRGLDCPVCGKKLEGLLLRIDGVTAADVDFLQQKIDLEYETDEAYAAACKEINGFEEVQIIVEKSDGKRLLAAGDGRVVIPVDGLDCPVCAMELEEILRSVKGVNDVSVDVVSQSVLLEMDDDGAVKKAIEKINKFENVKVLDGGRYALKREIPWKGVLQIIVSAVFFALAFLFEALRGFAAFNVLKYAAFIIAYISVGYPVFISTFKNICRGKIFDENFLMTVASIGAILLGEWHEGVAVMLLYQMGELLQGLAVGSSRKSIAQLMALKSETATLVTAGGYAIVEPESLFIGDTVLVKTGEKVPVDVRLQSEAATLDTKSLTGEVALVDVKSGDEILAGVINAGDAFTATVLRQYQDSATAKILELVENSTSKKAAPEKFIAKFAKVYTPVVCLLALAIAVFVPLIGYWAFGKAEFARPFQTALTFLVVSCPCALVISVPLTYFSGVGACAKNGILVKGATHLDTLAKTTAFAFDKTGTLTKGAFEILNILPMDGADEREILSIAATLEKVSTHPIGGAFAKIKQNLAVENVKEIAGKGLTGELDGVQIAVGNAALLKQLGLEILPIESTQTLVYVAKNGQCLGAVEIGDCIKSEAAETVKSLKAQGVKKTVMLTGDREETAKKIAEALGIDETYAGLLPDEKLKIAQDLQREHTLAFVGDGINDAPVMTVADCAVSMGTLGSAAAVEASHFVLVSDRLNGLVKALKIAKKTRKIVKQNVIFSILMKVAFMVLGALGVLPLWLAVFADVGVMLLAVLNSMRVRRKVKE